MILYYSATGNTKWVANQLSTFLCDERLYSITEVELDLADSLQPGEPLGLCFPIHAWGLPAPVAQVISRLHLPASTYIYSICTCGDDCGKVRWQLSRMLRKNGLRLAYMASVTMPNTYINLPGFDVDAPQVQQQKMMAACQLLPELARCIAQRKKGQQITEGLFPRMKSGPLRWFFRRFLVKDQYFHVQTDQCIGCGQCVAHCPMRNMLMEGSTPIWLHTGNCTTCMACYHHCPKQAIAFGRYTHDKGQYYFEQNQNNK